MPDAISQRQHLIHILKSFPTGSLITVSPENQIHGRPMAMVRVDDSGDIVLVTSFASEKRDEENCKRMFHNARIITAEHGCESMQENFQSQSVNRV